MDHREENPIGRRRGYTLLEIILASALLTTMATAAAVILRGGHMAWLAHEQDLAATESAQAVLRHIVRQARQAQAVSAISPASATSGTLSLVMPSGQTYVWAHDSTTDTVNFGIGQADNFLADGISSLTFVGYERDTVTTTVAVSDIRLIEARATIQRATGSQIVSCKAWIRTW